MIVRILAIACAVTAIGLSGEAQSKTADECRAESFRNNPAGTLGRAEREETIAKCAANSDAAERRSPSTETVLISDQTVSLFSVYWMNIKECQSRLKKVANLSVLKGSPRIELNLQQDPAVEVNRDGCKKKVPGANILATAKDVAAEEKVELDFVVTYETADGIKNSRHQKTIVLLPKAQ